MDSDTGIQVIWVYLKLTANICVCAKRCCISPEHNCKHVRKTYNPIKTFYALLKYKISLPIHGSVQHANAVLHHCGGAWGLATSKNISSILIKRLIYTISYYRHTSNHIYISQWPANMLNRLYWSYMSRLIPGLRPANERRRYKVTPSIIGWAQT